MQRNMYKGENLDDWIGIFFLEDGYRGEQVWTACVLPAYRTLRLKSSSTEKHLYLVFTTKTEISFCVVILF